jgi:TrmH family RNA methyltransferase
MSEENKNRTVKMTLDRKFGVSEKPERRPRRDDDREERGGREGRSFDDRRGDRGDRKFGDKKFGDRREGRFDRERRPRRDGDDRGSFGGREGRRPFGDRGRSFGGDRRPRREFASAGAPIYRQRPEEQKEEVEEVLDEAALEARVAEVEASEDSNFNPPWFKRMLALTTEKGREREGRFLGEGVHVVQELVSHHRELVLGVYVTEAFNDEALIEQINEAEIKLNVLTDEQMKKISSTVTTQGIVAVARIASKKPVYESSRSVITLVDAVQDPGNLGTLFRTSLGFGSDGMILGRGTVSPFNPKVVRGSSGTFLRVPFEFDVDLVDQINLLRS